MIYIVPAFFLILIFFMPVSSPAVEYDKYLPKWLELLKEGNDDEKKLALNNLWFLEYAEYRKDVKVFDPILDALKDKNPSVREAAADCLKKIGNYSRGCCNETNIIPSLIKSLNDNNPLVRAAAAKALGYFKDKRAVDALIINIKDTDPWVRLIAVSSLSSLREFEKHRRMMRIAEKPEKKANQGRHRSSPPLPPKETYVLEHTELGTEKAINPLIELLYDNSDWRYKFAQQESIITIRNITLGNSQINKEIIIKTLIQNFNDAYLKSQIIITLGSFRALEAKALLLSATKDSDEKIRKLALEALSLINPISKEQKGTIKDQNIEIFIKTLKDPSAEVRAQSVKTLGNMRNYMAIEPLMAALNDSNKKVRQAAIVALANFADERILEALIKHFGEFRNYFKNPSTESYLSVAKKTCKKRGVTRRMIHPAAADKLIDAANKPDTNTKLSILAIINNFEDDRIEPLLIKLLDDTAPMIRQKACAILINVGTDKAVPKLTLALKDQERNVRAEAARALGQIQDKRALEPLIESFADETDDNIRAVILTSLGHYNDPRILDLNINMIIGGPSAARYAAINNIKEKPDKRTSEILIPLLNDKDTGTASLAAEALGKIGDKKAVEPLTKILSGEYNKNGNNNINLKMSAAKSLGLIKDKKAIPALIKVVTDSKEHYILRSIAAVALREIDARTTLDILNSLLDNKTVASPEVVQEAINKIKGENQ